nr:MAG TPA: replisome organizer [Caudoviricetes sp.]
MNRAETLAIMSALKAAYPSFYRDMRREDAEAVVALWTEMFREEPGNVVAAAVKAHIASDPKGYPPHIGAIKAAIGKLRRPECMTEQEAWGLVYRAICNGYYGAEQEFAALPKELQQLVGDASQLREWAMMDLSTIQSVVASNFQRSYRAKETRRRELEALPSDVRLMIDSIAEKMDAKALTDGKEKEK